MNGSGIKVSCPSADARHGLREVLATISPAVVLDRAGQRIVIDKLQDDATSAEGHGSPSCPARSAIRTCSSCTHPDGGRRGRYVVYQFDLAANARLGRDIIESLLR